MKQIIEEMFNRDIAHFKKIMIDNPANIKLSQECYVIIMYIKDSAKELNLQLDE